MRPVTQLPALLAANMMDNRVWYTRWHDAGLTVWTQGVGMGTVHPVVQERDLRLAGRRTLVPATDDIDRSRWMELVAEIAAHFGLVRALVAHDQHLTTKPMHSMGGDEYTHTRL